MASKKQRPGPKQIPEPRPLPLLALLMDLFGSQRPLVTKRKQAAFIKDPDSIMDEYGLSKTARQALTLQDPERIATEIINELKALQKRGGIFFGW